MSCYRYDGVLLALVSDSHKTGANVATTFYIKLFSYKNLVADSALWYYICVLNVDPVAQSV